MRGGGRHFNMSTLFLHSSRSCCSGKEYMCLGIPSGSSVSFWALVYSILYLVKVSSCFCSSGMRMNASNILFSKSTIGDFKIHSFIT